MLVFVVMAVFIAGLMVGRTPEYLGKKIEAYDVQMAMLYLLIFPLLILGFCCRHRADAEPRPEQPRQSRPARPERDPLRLHLGTGNNGSAFAGLNANTHWYNYSLAVAMFFGRFMMIIPMLAIAGNLAAKKIVPASAGTFPVTTRCSPCC